MDGPFVALARPVSLALAGSFCAQSRWARPSIRTFVHILCTFGDKPTFGIDLCSRWLGLRGSCSQLPGAYVLLNLPCPVAGGEGEISSSCQGTCSAIDLRPVAERFRADFLSAARLFCSPHLLSRDYRVECGYRGGNRSKVLIAPHSRRLCYADQRPLRLGRVLIPIDCIDV